MLTVLERQKLASDRAPLAAMLGQYSSVTVKGDLIDVTFGSGKGFFVTSVRRRTSRRSRGPLRGSSGGR